MWPGLNTVKSAALRPHKSRTFLEAVLLTRDCFIISSIATVHNNPYPTAFPYGNGMVLHFYQQQESSTTKTVHKVINKGLKAYV